MTTTKPRRQRKAKPQPQEQPEVTAEVSRPEPLLTKEEKEAQRKQELRDKRYLPIMKVGQQKTVTGPVTPVTTVGLGKLQVITHGGHPNV